MKKITYLAPLALAMALTACGGAAETEGASSGEAVAEVAAPAGQQWSEVVAKTDAGGYVMGNPDAPIKLVEYMSITCSHCATFGEQAFDSIRDDYVNSGRVSFEVRNFVRDPLDLTAAILSRCGGEGPFFALTKQALNNQTAMFEKAQGMGEATYNDILKSDPNVRFVRLAEQLELTSFFQQRGVSADQAKACLSDEAAAEKLMADTQVAVKDFNISGTPTFLLNGKVVEGTNWPMIETKLKEAGAR
ncbi:DsbA family protein [Parasphingorhabdus halotolerans]|uniref:Thioredoxin domain-containing protein n=1 Tax=Parasphingorhabdus halotolerans TaxID=2725558 RepID=A0A6H2DN51_9SPHN|nr:thioredoxin domain-containing protein [Parasphingorhabdus halotolerans]QJB69181.1 thioredoxin domain-containing protein [Parasphingorhabdus halotolerans]